MPFAASKKDFAVPERHCFLFPCVSNNELFLLWYNIKTNVGTLYKQRQIS